MSCPQCNSSPDKKLCESCGTYVLKNNMSAHLKTLKHKANSK